MSPLPTRLFTLVDLEDATDRAHFRSAEDAVGWAGRIYGPHWRELLMLWDNRTEESVNV